MKKREIKIEVEQLTLDDLNETEFELVKCAQSHTYKSYAPYSKFNVGAAILLDNGEIVCGSNQENVAFPSGLCAERTAAFYAHSKFPDAKFRTIAIAARGTDGMPLSEPISPCGACRQSLLQYELLAESPVAVLLVGKEYIYRLPSISSLLPLAFTSL